MRKILLPIVLILMAFLLLAGVALVSGSYDLSWWTVDGGGGTSTGNGYTLNGTLGQPDAGTVAGGDGYTLAGGFWHGGVAANPAVMKIFLPTVTR